MMKLINRVIIIIIIGHSLRRAGTDQGNRVIKLTKKLLYPNDNDGHSTATQVPVSFYELYPPGSTILGRVLGSSSSSSSSSQPQLKGFLM